MDTRVRAGSGEWHWLRIRGVVVRNDDGNAQRIAGSMIDISRNSPGDALVITPLGQVTSGIRVSVVGENGGNRVTRREKPEGAE